MTITVAVRAGAGIASGSDLNVGYLAREDAESRAQGRAAGMAAFLKFVGESVDLSPEKPPKPSINAKSEPVKVDSAAIPGRNDGIVTKGVAKRLEIPPPSAPKPAPAYPPYAMRAEQAAHHFSMSRSMWLKLVDDKKMPPGFKIPGSTMRFWNTAECQDRFDDLGRDDGEPNENTVQKRLRELADERRKTGRSD
jgi:hypothetical protein